MLRFSNSIQLFRIGDRRGNDIAAAGPLPQINQAASLAAKRKVLLVGQHEGAADGAAERLNFLSGHGEQIYKLKFKNYNF